MTQTSRLTADIMTDRTLVSIIMPIRNEAAFIRRSLGSVLRQDYPLDRMEVLVVDGMSEDGTGDIVSSVVSERGMRVLNSPIRRPDPGSLPNDSQEAFINIRLLDNPEHIVPVALNIGLKHSRGEVIIRVDGHCEIPPDYVRVCVENLEKTGADCVGGPMVTVGETSMARAIAAVQSSFFGVGGVAFRTGSEYGGYVDTLAFGAYRREVFDRIGGFDEELVRNQDDEFNFRLTQAGGKIWLDPSIRSIYYSRASLKGLWRQYFQYGLYKVRLIQKRGGVPSVRHLVPAGFVSAFIFSIIFAIITSQPLWSLSVIAPYCLANMVASLWTARKNLKMLPILPIAFGILHFGYGLGFFYGLWRFRKKGFWRLGRG